MTHFKAPLGDPDALLIVVATPNEVRAFRPAVCGALFRHGVPSRDIDDLAQDAEFIAWRALEDGRVRGAPPMAPEDVLLGFLFMVARNLAGNYRLRARNRYEILVEPLEEGETPILDPADGRNPEKQIVARDLLARLASFEGATRVLLGAVLDEPGERIVKQGETNASTARSRLTRTRAWLRRSIDSGVWREPPQPTPRRLRDRKRGR